MTSDIRRTLLEVIEEKRPRTPTDGNLQSGAILDETARRLEIRQDLDKEQALLTVWSDLFRTGHLAWGHNLSNASPPFCHLTELGRSTLSRLSRDPAYPDGYLAHLNEESDLSARTESNLIEALACYNSNLHKAASVMLGVSLESIVIEMADKVIAIIQKKDESVPKKLKDWRLKTRLDALTRYFDENGHLSGDLLEKYQSVWPVFSLQIRTTRNDAGHPTDIEQITQDRVHASFLMFPELAKLAEELVAAIA
jgi:hypothetical protein